MVELLLEVELPPALGRCITAAVEAALAASGVAARVTVAVMGDEGIRALNLEHRGIDAATDVLSFPAWEGEDACNPPDGVLGDIAISLPKALRQAQDYGHSPARELVFLAVHGTLHLLGLDHDTPARERDMATRQEAILTEMGITQ